MSSNKLAYFQGTEEPTPKKKKYKSDPAILVQPRFKEPFYRNYDVYDVPGKHGPGAGWHEMGKYKSIDEFLKAKRKKLKDKYEADDSWIEDDGSLSKKKSQAARREILFLIKNGIDFPVDDQINEPILGDSGTVSDSVYIGGNLDEYLPKNDFEGKSPTELDFGRDYTPNYGIVSLEDIKNSLKEKKNESYQNIETLLDQYLNFGENDQYGLPDGLTERPEFEDLNIDNPKGRSESGTDIYTKMWI